MNKKIVDFISAQKILSLCTFGNMDLHCAICFYAYIPDIRILVIKSKSSTQHVQNALLNHKVAGTITPTILMLGEVKGIQFTATFLQENAPEMQKALKTYYQTLPMAVAVSGEIWGLQLDSVKMTDNTLGFGTKLYWNRESEKINL